MVDHKTEKSAAETTPNADAVAADDPHKAEKIAKAGRDDFDTDAGSD